MTGPDKKSDVSHCVETPAEVSKEAFALTVDQDDLAPRMRRGEAIIVDPTLEPMPGDEVAIITTDRNHVIRTLVCTREGQYTVEDINGKGERNIIPEELVSLIFVITGVYRKRAIKKSVPEPTEGGE